MDQDSDTPEFEGQIIFKGDYGHHSHKETLNSFKERLNCLRCRQAWAASCKLVEYIHAIVLVE